MKNNKITLIAFVIIALVQLYVPASMIFDKEDIINSGKAFKFKTAPVDPNDPFRGKFITLRFDQETVTVEDETAWKRNDIIYVSLEADLEGFAVIKSVSKDIPSKEDFIKAKVNYSSRNKQNQVDIEFPFERFYLEESKAPRAEKTYNLSQRDTSSVTHALVYVKDGEAVLQDVLIDDVSIVELVRMEKLKTD